MLLGLYPANAPQPCAARIILTSLILWCVSHTATAQSNVPVSKASDSFDRANASTTGSDWLNLYGGFSIDSNQALAGAGDGSLIRWRDDLDSVDHYAQITVRDRHDAGVYVRLAGINWPESEWYSFRYYQNAGAWAIVRRKAADEQLIQTVLAPAPAFPYTLRFVAEGSSLVGYANGIQAIAVTDALLRNTGVGMFSNRPSGRLDNFQAASRTAPVDSFNRPNANNAGPQWLNLYGGFSIDSNQALAGAGDGSLVRWRDDLDSVDHYAQITVRDRHDAGVYVRLAGINWPESEWYSFRYYQNAGAWAIVRRKAADEQLIQTVLAPAPAFPYTLRFVAEGSSLVGYANGIQAIAVTDALLRNTGVGMFSNRPSGRLDDFEARNGTPSPSEPVSACGDGVVGAGEACDTAASSTCAKDCSAKTGLIPCSTTADCGPGQGCPGVPNGDAFNAGARNSFCIPTALCSTTATPACGGADSVCGTCQCTPNCAGKQCGADPSDGCGGFCYGLCAAGQAGCTRDTDCGGGYICGQGNSWRYDNAAQSGSACWPAFCEDIDPRRIDCGPSGAPCGLCDPVATDKCLNGPLCGATEGPGCAAGTTKNAVGACVGTGATDVGQTNDNDVNTTSVGALPGSFSVSRAGSAQYVVPISVPPGRGGLAPDLAFSYDSHSGNGMLGLGWSLRGLSTISLCTKTWAFDVGFDGTPGFCLDGVRLVPVAFAQGKTEWRTEFESFSRVFSTGDFTHPVGDMTTAVFTVQRKDGTTLVYGAEDSAKLDGRVVLSRAGFQTSDSYTNTRAWALSRITDRAGNRIEIRYSALPVPPQGAGTVGPVATPPTPTSSLPPISGLRFERSELLPRWIGYNFVGAADGDAMNELVFEYDGDARACHLNPTAPGCGTNRPDALRTFSFGHSIDQTRLLKKVSIRTQGQTVRAYSLLHQPSANSLSMLQSIGECAYTADGQQSCRPPTTYDYEPADAPFVPTNGPAGLNASNSAVLDWNQDGYDDVVTAQDIFLGSASGMQHSAESFRASIPDVTGAAAIKSDYDGDGRDDVLLYLPKTNEVYISLRGAGVTKLAEVKLPTPYADEVGRGRIITLDVDGDGYGDMVYCGGSASSGYGDRFLLFRNGHGRFDPPVAFPETRPFSCDEVMVVNDEDGREGLVYRDYIDVSHFHGIWQSNSDDASSLIRRQLDFGLSAMDVMLQSSSLDVNGDGLRDLLFVSRKITGSLYALMLNQGGLDYAWVKGTSGSNSELVSQTRAIVPTDYDRDGMSDLLTVSTSSSSAPGPITLFNPRARDLRPTQLATVTGAVTAPLVFDSNGDGAADYFFPYDDGSGGVLSVGGSPKGNLLKTITIKNHATDTPDQIEIQYASGVATGIFTASDVLTCATPDSPMVCPRQLPAPVVQHAQRSAFAQAPGTQTPLQVQQSFYLYGALVVDRHGRGVVGFQNRGIDTRGAGGVDSVLVGETYDLSTHHDAPGNLSYYYAFASSPTHVTTLWAVPQNDLTTTGASVSGIREVTRTPEVRLSDKYRPFTVVTHETAQTSEGAVVDSTTTDRDYDVYGNLKEESIHWLRDGTESRHLLGYAYETDSSRISAWQTDLISSDVSADLAAEGPGGQVVASTSFTYDASGLLKTYTERATTNPSEGLLTTLGRDARNNINLAIQGGLSDGRVWSVQFDSLAGVYPAETSNPEGHVEKYAISYGDGLNRRYTDPNGLITSWKYDGFGRMLEEHQLGVGRRTTNELVPASLDTTQAVQTNGVLTLLTRTMNDRDGTTFLKQASYDTSGHLVATRGQAVSLAGAVQTAQEFRYDSVGRLAERSRPHLVSDASQGTESFSYDGLGRLISQVSADARETKTFYATSATSTVQVAGASRYRMEQAPNGFRMLKAFDGHGNLLQTQENAEVGMSYAYGAAGFLMRATDAVGNAITRTPDPFGRLTSVSDPDEGTHNYTYTNFGEIQSDTHNGALKTFTYDRLGRLKALDTADGQATWTWDTVSDDQGSETRYGELMAARSVDGHAERYTYQGPGGSLDTATTHVVGIAAPMTTRVEYDAFLRPSILHYPGSDPFAVRYRYDDAGNGDLLKVDNATNAGQVFWELKSVYQGVRPASVDFGDGTTRRMTYAARSGWLETARVSSSASTADLLSIALDHDANANVSGVRRLDDPTETEKTTYCYDPRDRLTGVTHGACDAAPTIAAFTYTPTGNIKTKTGMGTYSYGDPGQPDTGAQRQPHAVRSVTDPSVGTHHYEYDSAFGRMQSRSGPTVPTGEQSFTYTALGMLRSVTDANNDVERVEYGVSGGRALKKQADGSLTAYVSSLYEQNVSAAGALLSETRRVLAGGEVVAELTRTGAGVSSTRYLHRDHLGSVALVIDGATGAVLERPKSDVFGARLGTAASTTDLGFTGHRVEGISGLVDMVGRVYDPHLGRFLTPDPTIPDGSNTQAFNRYAYVYNNPATLIDPSGFSPFDDEGPDEPPPPPIVDGGGTVGGGGSGSNGNGGSTDDPNDLFGKPPRQTPLPLQGLPIPDRASPSAGSGTAAPSLTAGSLSGRPGPVTKTTEAVQEAWTVIKESFSGLEVWQPWAAREADRAWQRVNNQLAVGVAPGPEAVAVTVETLAALTFELIAQVTPEFVATTAVEIITRAALPPILGRMTPKGGVSVGRVVSIGPRSINPSALLRTEALGGARSRANVARLAESMRQGGWQGAPVKVFEHNGAKYIVDGHHRAAAARQAGIDVMYESVGLDTLSVYGYRSVDQLISSAAEVGPNRL